MDQAGSWLLGPPVLSRALAVVDLAGGSSINCLVLNTHYLVPDGPVLEVSLGKGVALISCLRENSGIRIIDVVDLGVPSSDVPGGVGLLGEDSLAVGVLLPFSGSNRQAHEQGKEFHVEKILL